MHNNQHADRLVILERQAQQVEAKIRRLRTDLNWFERFDPEISRNEFTKTQRENQILRDQLVKIENSCQFASTELSKAEAEAKLGWSPVYWFSSKRNVAVRQLATMRERLSLFKDREEEVKSQLSKNEQAAQRLSDGIRDYLRFNLLQTKIAIAKHDDELQKLQPIIEETREASAHWEAVAGTVFRNWKSVCDELGSVKQDIAEAEYFDEQLSSASTSHERAGIHHNCELHFGPGQSSPRQVLKDRYYRQRKLEQEEKKHSLRLRDITRLLNKKIRTLVVDGNNLCYRNEDGGKRHFIGLMALKVLVPRLVETFDVSIVFDPGICSQLKITEDILQAVFPEARVQVMPPNLTADHTVLAEAEFNTETYVISADRFKDYREMAAVRENRVLHVVLHRDSVQIPQLQILLPII